MSVATQLWAPQAWVDGRWQQHVLLEVDSTGHFSRIGSEAPAPPGATVLPGPVLPALVNAHSHAFQRAFAGLAERRSGPDDNFWSWRDRMYGVALRIGPDTLRAVAGQLYAELLQGGYTQVCEFHYLQHQPDGTPYPDRLALAQALMQAAADTGIGLTLLPVLYERAGFTQPALRDDQRRFATTASDVLALCRGVRAAGQPLVTAGVAIHSLRAARPGSITALQRALADDAGPIHIHIAEQMAEVHDCLAATGQRPIAWLADWLAPQAPLDARWHLVHATHATPEEIDRVAAAGAGVVLCPSTEANLGDGLPDLPRWLAGGQAGGVAGGLAGGVAGGAAVGAALSLGSDSHVTRNWPAELRLLEDAQRLVQQRRNVAADPNGGQPATAARLFDRVLAGGAAAAGFSRWGLQPGARADLLVLDTQADGLLGVPPSHTLDALVFAHGGPAFAEVWVAGQRRVAGGRHLRQAALRSAHAAAMAALWAGSSAG